MRAPHLALGLLTLSALSLTACQCGGHKTDQYRTSTSSAEYMNGDGTYRDGWYRTASGEMRYDPDYRRYDTARGYDAEHMDDTHATTSNDRTYDNRAYGTSNNGMSNNGTYNNGNNDRYGGTYTAGATVRSTPMEWDRMTSATATINPTRGNAVHGTVRFTKIDGGVRVVADLEGLQPRQRFGFHVHEFGDCSSPTGESVGDHFNPTKEKHGAPGAAMHHAGDLGNLESDANGRAHVDLTVTGLSIASGDDSILGRSVVVHEKADDMTSQPSGDSGSKLGCGTIGVARGTTAQQ
jgi:Cu-Zn family superoxide dismutase